ncbi:MAG: hypothetical protein ACI4C1_03325 [Lachnospiraceae bacterium]
MLEFLKDNLAFVAIVAIFGFGAVGKLIARHCYQMLLQQSENISSAKNKFLRQIKTKYEGVFRVNRGVKNTNAFITKQLYRYRYGLFRLETLDHFSAWGAALCFGIGVGNGLLLLRADKSSYDIIFSVGAGILAAVGMILVDRAADNQIRHQELITHIQDYLDNNVSSRMEANLTNGKQEAAVSKEAIIPMSDASHTEKGNSKEQSNDKVRSLRKNEEKKSNFSPLKSHGQEGASLKRSLEQAAASREEGNKKALSAEEEALMDEIIREYLS